MKRVKFILLFALMSWVMLSCEKDKKEGLGYDLEGAWRMLSHQVNGEEGVFYTDMIDYTIRFEDFNGNEGNSYWSYAFLNVDTSYTAYGKYKVHDETYLTVYWIDHSSFFTGGYDSLRFDAKLTHDTLLLECLEDDGGSHRKVIAVRD